MDIWSVGCIFAEMINKLPFLAGITSIDQLTKIFDTLGTPSEQDWEGMNYLPTYMPFPASPKISFRKFFPTASNEARDLLAKMLDLNPSKRISAQDALNHDYFSTGEPIANYAEISKLLNNRNI